MKKMVFLLAFLIGLSHFFAVENVYAAEKSSLPDRQQSLHELFSVDCFNRCWNFIEKAQRSDEDNENMILVAHASLWHWKQRIDCKASNLSVGYWQVSRAYALANSPELARKFAERCLEVSLQGKLGAFYVAYAYEALARAEFMGGNPAKANIALKSAFGQLALVSGKEEQGYLKADLDSLAKKNSSKKKR